MLLKRRSNIQGINDASFHRCTVLSLDFIDSFSEPDDDWED